MTGSVSATSTASARWVPLWGVAAVGLSNMPILEFTHLGAVVRFGLIAIGLLLFALNSDRILRGFGPIEATVVLIFLVISLVAALMPLFLDRNPDLGATLKLVFLVLLSYVLPKAMETPQDIERYLRFFYIAVAIAAAQAILSFGAFFTGLRHIGEININLGVSDGRYILSWWGLLGASQLTTPRTSFYYSEPSHFAHLLIIGLVYALATRRHFGALLMAVGMLTTIGLTAIGVSTLFFIFFIFRYGSLLRGLAVLAPIGIGLAAFSGFIMNSSILPSLLFRQHSANDKLDSLLFVLTQLDTHPFGIGLATASATLMHGINMSNGLLRCAVFYGFMSIPVLLAIYGFVAWRGLIKPVKELSGIMTLGMGTLLVATIFHGPLLKYWMVFLLSALVSYARMLSTARGPGLAAVNTEGTGEVEVSGPALAADPETLSRP